MISPKTPVFSELRITGDNHLARIIYHQTRRFLTEGEEEETVDPLEASRLVTDEYSAKILVATFKKAKSAIDLSREYGIPIAACYRRIHALERAGLIRCTERALTQKGKRISLYMSQLKNAYIFFENGRLRVRFQLATGITKDFGGDWKAVDVVEPSFQAAYPSQ